MNYSNITMFSLVLVFIISVWLFIENVRLHNESMEQKVSISIFIYNLELYYTLYGAIDKKDYEKAKLIVAQARRKEESDGSNPI